MRRFWTTLFSLSLFLGTLWEVQAQEHPNRISPTPTVTPTATQAVPTPTFTPTVSFTPTGTLFPSLTPTQTPTSSYTQTPSSTATNSATGTSSPAFSSTPTPTLTPTSTVTPTPTMTATNSPTATPTNTSTPGVFKFSVSPKPDAQNQIHFGWGTTIPADEAFLRIYTSGFRLVRDFNFNKDEKPEYLTSGTHEITWDGRDDESRPMPPGNYLCFISVTVGKKTYEASGKTEIP